MILTLMMIPFLGQSLVQPTSTTLANIWTKAYVQDGASGRAGVRDNLTEQSWSRVRPASAYGVVSEPGRSRYSYRIPPDWNESDYPRSAVRVESYLDGFPIGALRADGDESLARPLGFEYGSDGYCTNARVEVRSGKGWITPALNARGKTFLVRVLALFENRYDTRREPIPDPKQRLLWFKITADGYGTYLFYWDLLVISPQGTRCRLLPEQRSNLEDGLRGYWNKGPSKEAP